MIALGLDTSNYRTSAALADDRGRLLSKRLLLPVKPGAVGLRQNEAVFLHNRQLPELLEQLFLEMPVRPDCIAASVTPSATRLARMSISVRWQISDR